MRVCDVMCLYECVCLLYLFYYPSSFAVIAIVAFPIVVFLPLLLLALLSLLLFRIIIIATLCSAGRDLFTFRFDNSLMDYEYSTVKKNIYNTVGNNTRNVFCLIKNR